MNYYFTEGSSGVCVGGIGSKLNTGVSKVNSASSHIWLKTKLIIASETLRIDRESFSESIIFSHPYLEHILG